MIIRIILIILVILATIGIMYWLHRDYNARKSIKWETVGAEIVETKFDEKITTDTNTTKWYDSNQRQVNVYVEKLSFYSSQSTQNKTYTILAKYKYSFPEGREHESWAPIQGGLKLLDAENKVLDYPDGKKITVYVQEKSPNISQIIPPDQSYPTLYMIMTPLISLLFCLIIWFSQESDNKPYGRRYVF